LREAVLPLADLVDPNWVVRFGEALQAASRQAWTAESLAELGRILLARTRLGALDDAVMVAMLRILKADGRDPVGGLAGAVGLSPSTLRRRFRAELELTPKELARIRRVRASAVDAVAGGHWAGIAADRGFSDQAHLVREFQELLGRPPESFRAHGNQIQHRLLKP
jgi:AraC-like DNA-binding protein